MTDTAASRLLEAARNGRPVRSSEYSHETDEEIIKVLWRIGARDREIAVALARLDRAVVRDPDSPDDAPLFVLVAGNHRLEAVGRYGNPLEQTPRHGDELEPVKFTSLSSGESLTDRVD